MEQNQNELTYQCKASLYTPGLMVAIITGIGMPVIFLTIYIHPIVAGLAMVASMYVAMLAMSGPTTFTLDGHGIKRVFSPFLNWRKNKKPQPDIFKWNQLQWFREGKDKGRFSAEYRFLTVHFKNGTEWMITDNNGVRNADFEVFLETFKKLVVEYNALAESAPAVSSAQHKKTEGPVQIQQRKTFYETIWAKAFTILLGFFIVGILFLMVTTSYVSATSMFKLFVILIPGFIYMWYRVFREKK